MRPLEPLRSLMEITADRIRDAIISGELPLGSKLSEHKLAEMLGISRSPVHNALALLQYEGLVVVQPKVGSFVFTPGIEEALDLCEHRSILECASLQLALEIDPDELVRKLDDCTARMKKAMRDQDSTAYTKCDIDFHSTIVKSGGNGSMSRAYSHTIGPLMALRTHLFNEMNAHLDRSFAEHIAIVDACRGNKVEEATSFLRTHIGHLVAEYQALQKNSELQTT